MQVGINQDIVFKGERFHLQTEDSGVKRPVISTVLFKGGVIVASRKTGYEDILDSDTLEKDVTELMQRQHKQIMHALKNGEFEKGAQAKVTASPPISIKTSPKPPVEPPAEPVSLPPEQAERKAPSKRPLMVSSKVLEAKVLECLSLTV